MRRTSITYNLNFEIKSAKIVDGELTCTGVNKEEFKDTVGNKATICRTNKKSVVIEKEEE